MGSLPSRECAAIVSALTPIAQGTHWKVGTACFTGPPTPAVVGDTFPLGIAAKLLVDAGRERLSIASLIAWLATPIKLGQIIFLTSWERTPLGFATWAYLAPATLRRMAAGEQDLPLLDDWNEGSELWIVDLVAPYGHAAELFRHLRAQLGQEHNVLHYRRRGRYRRTALRFSALSSADRGEPATLTNLTIDEHCKLTLSPFDRGWGALER